MRKTISGWLVLGAALALGACGDDDGGTTPQEEHLTTAELTTLCEAICARETACEVSPPSCGQACLDAWPEQHLLAPQMRALVTCYTDAALTCPAFRNPDTLTECLLGIPNANQQAFLDACFAASQACTSGDIDACLYAAPYDAATIAQLAPCLDLCGEAADTCIADILFAP